MARAARRRAPRTRRRPTAAPRPPRAARNALALALILLAGAAAPASAATQRFLGEVTDALRVPTHRLHASTATGRALADLVFVDREQDRTKVRTCVRRQDGVRTCFSALTAGVGVANVTPLRFRRGRYVVRWSVGGTVVARWRFRVD